MSTEKIPTDFLYMGERLASDGKLCEAIRWLRADGPKDALYQSKRGSNLHVVGGRYTGAAMSPDGALGYGVLAARWAGERTDDEQVVAWEAAHTEAQREVARKRLESKVRGELKIDDMTVRELRVLCTKMQERGDWHEAQLLAQAASLRINKRATEADKEALKR